MTILQTEHLKKYYGTGDTQVRALDGVDFSVENGEFVCIVGTSGSGNSTLLHMLGGLDRPTSGKVFVDGQDISGLAHLAGCAVADEGNRCKIRSNHRDDYPQRGDCAAVRPYHPH